MNAIPTRVEGQLVLSLARTYYQKGTNGTILLAGQPICQTIELPWRQNRRNVSCIPEGRYRLQTYASRRFGYCLLVAGVSGRSGILIHAANHAATELQGCIAPVTKHTGQGRGIHSRIALERLEAIVMPVLEADETVWLEIAVAGADLCVRPHHGSTGLTCPPLTVNNQITS